MNIALVLRDSWRITWKHWRLWVLNLLLFVVFAPASTLAGGFGAVAGLLAVPFPGPQAAWMRQLRQIPGLTWAGIAVVALIVLVATTCVSWIVQAASMRGAAMAADKGSFTLSEALRLGRQRLVSLLKLSLTFGVLITALGLAPPLLILLVGQGSPAGLMLINGMQTFLAPLSFVLGIALLLVMMSIALEDLKPGAAFKRGWQVFGAGWWAFAFVLGITIVLTLIAAVVVGVLVIPLAVGVTLIAAGPPAVGWAIVLADGLIILAVSGPMFLFIAVFTIVLYTLTYREAARLTAAPAK